MANFNRQPGSSLQTRLNSAQPQPPTKFSTLSNGQYIVTSIRAFVCASRFGGGTFRAVRVEIIDMVGVQHVSYLPSYVARIISDEDINNMMRGGTSFEKRGNSIEWSVADPARMDSVVNEQDILDLVVNV
jgi:hypothetical protein